MPSLIKDSTITLLARGLIFVLAMATSIVISRVLGPTNKGVYSLVILLVSVVNLLVLLGLGPANVYFGAREPKTIPVLFGNSLVAALGLGAIGVLAAEGATFLPPVQAYLLDNGANITWVRLSLLVVPLMLANAYLPELLRASGDIVRYNLASVVDVGSTLLGALLLVWLLKLSVPGALGAWAFSNVAELAFTLFLLFRLTGRRIGVDRALLRKTFAFGAKLYPGNLAQFLNYRLDIFLVAFFLAPAQVGFYVTATTLAERMWEVPHAIRTVLLHRVARADEGEDINQVTARVVRVVVTMVGLMCLLLVALSYPLIRLLYGSVYLPAAPALIALMPGVWALSIGKLLAIHLAGIKRPEIGSYGALLSLVATLLLDLLLIPRLGIVGAALASSISYSLSTVVIAGTFLRVSQLPARDLFLLKREDLRLLWRALQRAMGRRAVPRVAPEER